MECSAVPLPRPPAEANKPKCTPRCPADEQSKIPPHQSKRKDETSMSSLPAHRHDQSHEPLHCHASLVLCGVDTPRQPSRQHDTNHTVRDGGVTCTISSLPPGHDNLTSPARPLPRRPLRHPLASSMLFFFFFFFSPLHTATAWSPPAPSASRPKRLRPNAAFKHSHESDVDRRRPRSSDPPPLHRLKRKLDSLRFLLESLRDDRHDGDGDDPTDEPLDLLREMLALHPNYARRTAHRSTPAADAILDEAFRLVSAHAFSPPDPLDDDGDGDGVRRINLGMKTLRLQLRSGDSSVPRTTWLRALRALTRPDGTPSAARIEGVSDRCDRAAETMSPADAAFRILQRLVTGRGVRPNPAAASARPPALDERDFNMVLHAYAALSRDRMVDARRVVALQERTGRAPPLSPVGYSILLKAYGRWGDAESVENTISKARRRGVLPDVVMANTALDAYVNCGLVGKAEQLFRVMMGKDARSSVDERYWPRFSPNSRTYNILLKGMAKEGRLQDALALSEAMRSEGIWDHVATNTLVKAAVAAQEFAVAETVLANSTATDVPPNHPADHPNVEAYTELIDGYAKDGRLEKALEIMQRMQRRGVAPNEYTYTCIVGALARNNKVRQAKKMMDYATTLHFPSSKRGKRILTPTFNAYLSGLLSTDGAVDGENAGGRQSSHSLNILEAFRTLNEMEKINIHPNVVTVTLLVDGLANCDPPRCKEAEDLVRHLERTTTKNRKGEHTDRVASERNSDRIVSSSNAKIATALIRAYGRANDVDSAATAFRRISNPDVVALNVLLDACCRCSRMKLAFELFEKYASFEKWRDDDFVVDMGPNGEETRRRPIKPDVVTYTTLIAAILQLKNKNASKRASRLYEEMKQRWRISPDTVLIDKILMAMTSSGPRGFETDDIQFTLTALRDGDRLRWDGEQYQKRKKAVRSVLMACSSEVWKKDDTGYGLMMHHGSEPPETEDPLFLKKGWNKIDSGFRLWGGGNVGGGDGIR